MKGCSDTSKVICVRLPDAQVWFDFQAYVALAHGHVKGSLGAEVANALKMYLENKRTKRLTRTHVKSSSKTMKNLREITNRIIEVTEKEIPQTHVERIITECAGGEPRTLQRYLASLYSYGILKPVRTIAVANAGKQKYIFEVNLDEAKKFVGLP